MIPLQENSFEKLEKREKIIDKKSVTKEKECLERQQSILSTKINNPKITLVSICKSVLVIDNLEIVNFRS